MPPPARIRLLLVEDDGQVAQAVRAGLDPQRFALAHAVSIAAARRCLAGRSYDALILDLKLPDGSGLSLADGLRAAGSGLPILVLTAQSGLPQRLEGFGRGADDYLCKPFAVEELVARLGAILKRVPPERRHILRYADVELDLLRRVVRRGDTEVSLSSREADLLAYLIRHAEEVLPPARVIEDVWGDEAEDQGGVVNVYINYLRNKLEARGQPRLIHTVRGIGYVLSGSEP